MSASAILGILRLRAVQFLRNTLWWRFAQDDKWLRVCKYNDYFSVSCNAVEGDCGPQSSVGFFSCVAPTGLDYFFLLTQALRPGLGSHALAFAPNGAGAYTLEAFSYSSEINSTQAMTPPRAAALH
jgi:hypothetical protein